MKKTKILLSAVIAMLCFSSVNVNADSLVKKDGEKRVSFLDLLKDNEECKEGKCKHNRNKEEDKKGEKKDKRKVEEKQETRDRKEENDNKPLENVKPSKDASEKEIEE